MVKLIQKKMKERKKNLRNCNGQEIMRSFIIFNPHGGESRSVEGKTLLKFAFQTIS